MFSLLLLRFQNLTWQTQDLLPNSSIRFSIHIKMTWLPSFTSNNWISWECWYCKFTMRVKSWHLKLFNFKSLILHVQLHVQNKALSSSHLSDDWRQRLIMGCKHNKLTISVHVVEHMHSILNVHFKYSYRLLFSLLFRTLHLNECLR